MEYQQELGTFITKTNKRKKLGKITLQLLVYFWEQWCVVKPENSQWSLLLFRKKTPRHLWNVNIDTSDTQMEIMN